MKPAAFSYVRPDSLDALFKLLAAGQEDVAVLAGGQSLIAAMNFRMARPERLIDLSGIAALSELSAGAGALRIGAMVTHAQLEDMDLSGAEAAFLRRVAGGIAFRAIRNRGTIGGSLGQADPAADWLTALSCLQAQVEMASAAGSRRVEIGDFVLAPMTTDLKENEIVTAVVVPPGDASLGWHKAVRKSGEFAEALAAVRITREGAQCWIGAIDSPVRLDGFVDPQPLTTGARLAATPAFEALSAAVRAAVPDVPDYSVHLAAVSVCHALSDAQRQGSAA